MSGIAALLRRDGRPADADDVVAMLAAIPYRGPDGRHVRVWQQVVLGHAKLAVTAEAEAEQQPLISPRSGCAVVADARLDNRDELLACFTHCPPSASDAELILRAYETWGLAAPEHLLGDFAFAIWDPSARHLVCARDGSGQRPLFYRQDRRAFAAASEIHQLLQDPRIPVSPNGERIHQALVPFNLHRNERDQADTYYTGIRSVLAGQILVIDERSFRSWQFWALNLPRERRYRNSAECVDHFRATFFEAVRVRLRTSRSLGVLLSGGLDSSAITCAAQELFGSGRAVDTGFASLSVVYKGLDCDERPYIEATQEKYGFTAHYLAPDLSIESPAGQFTGFRERPNLLTSGFDTVLREASRHGIRSLLTGELGDACLLGTPLVFDSLLKQGRPSALWQHLRAYRALTLDPWLKIAALYLVAPLLPLATHRWLATRYVRRVHARSGQYALPPWMPRPLRETLASRHLELHLEAERQRVTSSESRHQDMLGQWPPESVSSPAGWPIEISRPFADRRLQELLLAVPPTEKFAPHPTVVDEYAGSKQMVRRGLVGILPESVRTRETATHFASAAEDRLRRQWAGLERWFGPDARPRIAQRGYVEREHFWERLQQMRDGRLGMDLLHLDYCLGLESWLRSLEQPRFQAMTVQTPWPGTPDPITINHAYATATLGATP